MQTLTEIITAEDKKHPLSDEELRLRLLDGGLDIARRTVAKYRERLGAACSTAPKRILRPPDVITIKSNEQRQR